MRPLRIIHYCPELNAGSVGRLAVNLASALQASGHENYIISPSHEMLGRLSTVGVKHVPVYSGSTWNFLYRIRRGKRYFGDAKTDIFQIYSIEYALRAFLPYYLAMKSKGTKLVATHTRFLPPSALSSALRYYSAATACSQALRDYVQNSGKYNAKAPFWHIPNGVNERDCHPEYRASSQWMRQWQSSQPQTSKRFLLTLPCNISPIHGLEDLVPIVHGLKQRGIPVHVLITGETRAANAAYLTALRQRYLSQGIAEHVTWLGARQDLRDILSVSHVTLSLARQPATYNRAILEALSLARPVAAYDHGSIGEMLQCFLPEGRVTPHDSTAMVELLSKWYVQPPQTIREIPHPYRFQDTVQSYLQLYYQISTES